MKREDEAEYLKKEIYKIIKSLDEKCSEYCPDKEIITGHVPADLFVEMAYCFIAKHGK